MAPDYKIIKFIQSHHVMTLATSVDNAPYCCNLFYAYDEPNNTLIFTSDNTTRHTQMFLANSVVAGSIVLESNFIGKIRGLQLTGKITAASDQDKSTYIKRFPYTRLAELTLWRLEISYMKYTDNNLGFGKKLVWEK